MEIGPGLGALTLALLQRIPRLAAVEIDRDLAARWRKQAPDTVELIEADALDFDFSSLGGALRIVGNLPYNTSTPLLFHLMDVAGQVRDQHFMLQKEVIDRMVAAPGGRDFGRLSVMLQWRYRMDNLLDVPPEAFDPPPAADSAVVRMVPLPVEAASRHRPRRVVCTGDGRVLTAPQTTAAQPGPWLERQGFGGPFDLQRRAEEVSTAEYVALAQSLPKRA